MTHDYLMPLGDSLTMRESRDYAKDKLTILKGYMARFTTAMKEKKWRALNYIDLQAGPGKNRFSPSGDIMLGSPLLAFTTRFPFDNLFLVEMENPEFEALESRFGAGDRVASAKLYNEDCNVAVDKIVEHIGQMDGRFIRGQWPSLNLAFLDPEGVEIEWKTVKKLASLNRMDLIINFSTSGITRNAGQYANREEETIFDRFFGTREWRSIYQRTRHHGGPMVRRESIDFYLGQLNAMGYVQTERQEREFKNQRNVQIYTMIFASKNDLGIKFWNGAIQEVNQPRLL